MNVPRLRVAGSTPFLLLVACALFITFSVASGALNQDVDDQARLVEAHESNVASQGASHENLKWVVITTISYPTDAVKKLAAMPGWRLVVVADLKTPKDWQLEGADFLSIDLQNTLKYTILKLLPDNHYGRKNIGYLWAIEHGATEIYETDDDNLLLVDTVPTFKGLKYFVYDRSSLAVNVYPHFGEKMMWPRGFPLDSVRKQNNSNSFIRTEVKPLVLQGLANVDPDVDAIYRLTLPLGITFDKDATSVALPSGAFCPFNSQNTLFARDALWGLLIPVTTTFRVCDIWRGYWVQRMLWQVEGHLAFETATVDQHRNPHRLLLDFADELDLYAQAGELVQYLSDWRPQAEAFEDQLTELAVSMAEKGFWKTGDAQLMKAWVHDLQTVGYKFPKAKEQLLTAPLTIVPSTSASIPTPPSWARQYDMILVIHVDTSGSHIQQNVHMLHNAYFPLFQYVIFTGGEKPSGISEEVHWVGCNAKGGSFQYACLANVIKQTPVASSGGYLFLSDGVLFSHCQLSSFNRSRIWYHSEKVGGPSNTDKHSGHHSKQHRNLLGVDSTLSGQALAQVLPSVLSSREHANHYADAVFQLLARNDQEKIEERWAQGFYIPQRLATEYAFGAAILRQANVRHGVAVPLLLGLLDGEPFEMFEATHLGQHQEKSPRSVLPSDEILKKSFLFYPFQMSRPGATDAFHDWWYNASVSHHCAHANQSLIQDESS